MSTMTRTQAEQRWLEIGGEKLEIRRTIGWRSEEALDALRPLNREMDQCLAVMRLRGGRGNAETGLRSRGGPKKGGRR